MALVSVISLWQTSQATRVNDVVLGSQGNGTYVESMTQTLHSGQVAQMTLVTSGRSNVLQLKPIASRGPVTISLVKGKHTVKQWRGAANKLATLKYPMTAAGRMQVIVRNISKQSVTYGIVTANYSPVTGRVTAQPRNYLQYVVKRHTPKPQTLTTGTTSLAIVLLMLVATWLALRRLRPTTEV